MAMPILRIPLGDTFLGLYNIPFFGFFILKFVQRKKFLIHKDLKRVYFFAISLAISEIFSWTLVDKDWYMLSLRAALKMIMVIFLILMNSNDILLKIRKDLLAGIKLAAIVNFVWIIFEIIFWKIGNIMLNTVVFGVKTTYEGTNNITYTGLSWERADTVLVFAIVTALSRNIKIRLVCLIGTILTSSRTGLLMLVIIYAYEIVDFIKKRKGSLKIKKETIIKVFIIVMGIFLIFLLKSNLVKYVTNNLNYIIDRIKGFIYNVNEYSVSEIDPHKLYYMWLPYTLKHSNLLQLFFGSGTRISGWLYTAFFGRFQGKGPWSIECDFISILLGNGLLGLLVYYSMLIIGYFRCRDKQYKAILFMLIITSFTYQFYTSTLGLILIIILQVPSLESYKVLEKQDIG